MVTRGRGQESRREKLLINEREVSIMQGEQVLETCCTTGYLQVTILSVLHA